MPASLDDDPPVFRIPAIPSMMLDALTMPVVAIKNLRPGIVMSARLVSTYE